MAGAVDLLLYGVAIFVSPLAVYFKKGVGTQFWVNCCLYCLMGVPGAIHAFYIIHTNKDDKRSRQGSTHAPSIVVTQQRSSNLPSLPHPDRYRPPASYSPYEDHPPPLPPKQEEEEQLPYDPALHPNASGTHIARAKAVLHTYQIPDSTLHPPPPRRSSRSPNPPTPRPEPQQVPQPEQEPQQVLQPEQERAAQPEPEPVQEPEPQASSSAAHTDTPTLAYPAEYHPNVEGRNIANAKAVLHTYQIPERTFPPPEPESAPENAPLAAAAKTTAGTTGAAKGSMWSLRSKGKGISSLDINSPTEGPAPARSSATRAKWASSGPSWLKRRKNRQGIPSNPGATTTTTEDEDGPGTMTMMWNDKYDAQRTPGAGGTSAKHGRTGSEPVSLPFPMPPGAVRPVVDRTGTSNTILRRPFADPAPEARSDAAADGEGHLDVVDEDATPKNERTLSEGESGMVVKKARRGSGQFDTDVEAPVRAVGLARTGGLRSRLSRRRPRLDAGGRNDAQAPNGVTSAPPPDANVEPAADSPLSAAAASAPALNTSFGSPKSSSPTSPTWHRHIASPAFLASSIEEPRRSIFKRGRTNSTSPTSNSPPALQSQPTSQLRPTTLSHNDIDFVMGEYGLGGAGDAYSAGSRALQSRTRTTSSGAGRQLSGGAVSTPRERTGSGARQLSGGLSAGSSVAARRRLSAGTGAGSPTPTSEVFGVPAMRRGLTQGTFGTGVTGLSSSTGATSEESVGAKRPEISPRGISSKSEGHLSEVRPEGEEEELSQEEEVERWIKREDERRQSSLGHSYSPDAQSNSQAHSSLANFAGPDEASMFSEESSGFAGIGVGSAVEKGRAGKLEVWDQPGWDGSNPSVPGAAQTSKQLPDEADPFRDPVPASASEDTHTSSYVTGRESFSPVQRSPPARPTRAPPAVPKSTSPSGSRPAPPLRMGTFGTAGVSGSTTSFGLLSPPRETKGQGKGPASPESPIRPVSLTPARPPPVPSRPSTNLLRPQSPKLPPKPLSLRTMSTDDDDLSAVYARALRDEI